ncbi:hyalin-like [Lytechinus variegatus]|uniref:hyalin-like n=1 Tax=Lytechinus variegatus TaxID=7654 RepID=UPI001BB26A8F|nr:hyalin-like [Lytechinus variegatus]
MCIVKDDNENPVITGCPSNQDVNTDSGNATALVTWTPPKGTDNSGTQRLTSTANPGDYFPIGNNTVNYTSTDAAGNTGICTFYISVTDNENPVISGCPSNQDVTTDIGNATALVTWTPPKGTDNSGTQTLTSTANPGDYLPIGNNTVNYTSTDAAGNTDTYGQTFLVIFSDNENPVITGCPSNQDVNTDSGNATALVTWTPPKATDNSGTQTLTSTANPGDYFPIGNNTVKYTSTDAAGNTGICTFYISVTDNENPVISGCPSNQDVTTDIGNATALVTWAPPTATDNSGTQTLTSTANPGDYLPIGNNTVNYTSTDAAGNTDTCFFYISVTDNENPVITGCPSNQDVNTDSGNATALVTWTPPKGTDNSGTQRLTSTANPGDYFPIGNNTVNYTSTDAAGNTGICTFYISVTDNENPVISGCPSNQDVTTDIGNATALVTWTPPKGTDNSGTQTLTSTANPGDYLPIGNNTVNYTSTDAAGNTDTCIFYISVTGKCF